MQSDTSTSEEQRVRAQACADWLKAPRELRSDAFPNGGCGELDAQPIMLRLGRAWYIAAEYQHQLRGGQLDKIGTVKGEPNVVVARAPHEAAGEIVESLFETRIYVLGKPHVKDAQGRTPWISCRYVWVDREDATEWYISTAMDVEFTREHHARWLNPEWKKYHPFGSWFALHRVRNVHGITPRAYAYHDPWESRKRVSMEIVDL